MARKSDPFGAVFGFFFLFLMSMWFVGTFMWKDKSTTASSSVEPHSTVEATIPECGENSFTAGNAFYTVMALCFANYAYPRGSLIASPSGRTWRLSPVLVLEELGVGLALFFIARRSGTRLATFCHAIVAYRLSNGFNSETLSEDLDLTIARPPQNDLAEVYRIVQELKQQPNADVSHRGQLVPQNQTVSANSEDLELGRLVSSWDEARKKVSDRWHEYNIHLFTHILRRLKVSENGPSYRMFIWLPVLLQMIKLMCVIFVSQRMSWIICSIAFTYFFAWLAVELTMLQVSRHSLSDQELADAAELCHKWKTYLKEWIGEDTFDDTHADVNAFEVPSLVVVSAFNLLLTGKFLYDLGLPKFESFWLAVLVLWCLVFAWTLIFHLFTRPWVILVLLWIINETWRAIGAEAKLGKLWRKAPAEDAAALYTATAALYGACLFTLALAGVGPWKGAFHCWEMQIPPFYDWLG